MKKRTNLHKFIRILLENDVKKIMPKGTWKTALRN